MENRNEPILVDLLSATLQGAMGVIYWILHNPHNPPTGDIEHMLQRMLPEERTLFIARAKTLVTFGKAVEAAAAKTR